MRGNKEVFVLNYKEMVDWIDLETKYDRDTITYILDTKLNG